MRPIKFRAWDKRLQKWFYLDLQHALINQTADPRSRIEDWSEWMQFTGLYSKSGVEIYEGDVVKMDAGTNDETICSVSWLDDGFVLVGEGYFAEHLYPQIRDGRFGEIIGNIYENPELIQPEVPAVPSSSSPAAQ